MAAYTSCSPVWPEVIDLGRATILDGGDVDRWLLSVSHCNTSVNSLYAAHLCPPINCEPLSSVFDGRLSFALQVDGLHPVGAGEQEPSELGSIARAAVADDVSPVHVAQVLEGR